MNKEENKPKNGVARGQLDTLVRPHFRVVLLKVDIQNYWNICSNPKWGHTEKGFSDVLLNLANDYVEYKNCGVKHRMIRFGDIDKYIEDVDSFEPEWALDPSTA